MPSVDYEVSISDLLVALYTADREAIRAKEQLMEVLGQTQDDPFPVTLRECTFAVGDKQFLGLVTTEQCEALRNAASSGDEQQVIDALGVLLRLVDTGAIEASRIMAQGLQPKPVAVKDDPVQCAPGLGCCKYGAGSEAQCISQSQCTVAYHGTWTAGPCGFGKKGESGNTPTRARDKPSRRR